MYKGKPYRPPFRRDVRPQASPNKATHFVAIKVDNVPLLENIEKFRQRLVEQNPSLSDSLTSLAKMHVSLLVMQLQEEEISKATEAIQRGVESFSAALQNETETSCDLTMNFSHVRHFAGLEEETNTGLLHSHLVDSCVTAGISIVGSGQEKMDLTEGGTQNPTKVSHGKKKPYTAHMTLAKIDYRKDRFRGGEKLKYDMTLINSMMKNFPSGFGAQTYKSVQLLAIGTTDENGYYETIAEYSLQKSRMLKQVWICVSHASWNFAAILCGLPNHS